MSAPKGLGKGLGALISMFDEDNEEIQKASLSIAKMAPKQEIKAVHKTDGGVNEIDITLIDNNVNQPRKLFDPAELDDLVSSIKVNGILSPILLTKVGSRYMIVAGERRWRAAQKANLKTVPAIVRTYTPRQVAEIALVENLQRADLNEIEIANGVKKLMDTFYMTQEQVSTCLGKPRTTIANTLRILSLPKEVQTLIQNNELSTGHAKCLAALSMNPNLCIQLARQCVSGKLSVRALEDMINKALQSKQSSHSMPQRSLELKDLAETLTKSLAARVTINGTVQKGKIIIEYSDFNELDRIRTKLSR